VSKLAHTVFFQLKDATDANRKALVAACQKYLTGHPGVDSFAVGTLEPELARPVNVRDWDVSLHLVFATRADHDVYQDAPRHHEFVNENKETWAYVRVFDSLLE